MSRAFLISKGLVNGGISEHQDRRSLGELTADPYKR